MVIKDVGKGPRDHPHFEWIVSDAFHCERFSGSCLAVGEDGSIEALKDRINQRRKRLLVKVCLFGVPVVNKVKGKRFRRVGWTAFWVSNLNLTSRALKSYDTRQYVNRLEISQHSSSKIIEQRYCSNMYILTY